MGEGIVDLPWLQKMALILEILYFIGYVICVVFPFKMFACLGAILGKK